MPYKNRLLLSFALLCAAGSARAESFYFDAYQQDVPAYLAERADASSPAAEVFRGGSEPIVRGSQAVVRKGIAFAPAAAPDPVKRAIWAANTLRRKPYKWGGGHRSFNDSGYDCSGTISYALHSAGILGKPFQSSDFLSFGQRGCGKWITVYSRNGHTFAVIAGLRLDTTGRSGTEGPRWHEDGRDTGRFEARHPVGL